MAHDLPELLVLKTAFGMPKLAVGEQRSGKVA
jgi:hypothetical protein